MSNPLYLNFLWHFHQPFYKDLRLGEYVLPWTFLHSIKDYLFMLRILDDFPSIKVTFNLVPSLLEQIMEYSEKNIEIKDRYLNIMMTEPGELTESEKVFMLKNFFSFYPQTMITPFPRYNYLYQKRGGYLTSKNLSEKIKSFTVNEFNDLQVYFLLTCYSQIEKAKDKNIQEMIRKAENFSAQDKNYLVKRSFELMDMIIPQLKKLENENRIEISVSPFYHPILPLLCDSDISVKANPNCKGGDVSFKFPEDAYAQVKYSLEFMEKTFNLTPHGMWPSEGALSMETLKILKDNNISWTATDEAVLLKSLGLSNQRDSRENFTNPDILYRMYNVPLDGDSISIFFRDHKLSDDIAFRYHKMHEHDAIEHFIGYINNIHSKIKDKNEKYILNIIMDGENAWEYYNSNGYYFLNKMYSRLSQIQHISTITPSEFIKLGDSKVLNRLQPGSWINGDLCIWIGHPEDNKSWEYLGKARYDLMKFEKEFPEKKGSDQIINAWKSFHIAEGSDWNWWYGEEHSSLNEADFDQLYRNHLANIYRFLKLDIPAYLLEPIAKNMKVSGELKMPSDFISPTIDGKNSTFYEWLKAGHLCTVATSGSMHEKREVIITDIYFGVDFNNIYIRLDLNESIKVESFKVIKATIKFIMPENIKIEFFIKDHSTAKYVVYKKSLNYFEPIAELVDIAFNKIIELKVPFDLIGIVQGEECSFFIVLVDENNDTIEVNPIENPLKIKRVSAEEFETLHWSL